MVVLQCETDEPPISSWLERWRKHSECFQPCIVLWRYQWITVKSDERPLPSVKESPKAQIWVGYAQDCHEWVRSLSLLKRHCLREWATYSQWIVTEDVECHGNTGLKRVLQLRRSFIKRRFLLCFALRGRRSKNQHYTKDTLQWTCGGAPTCPIFPITVKGF